MKWNKDQFGGRKVTGQAIVLADWAQKVPSILRRQ